MKICCFFRKIVFPYRLNGFFVGDFIRQDLGSNLVNLSFINISIGFGLVAILGLLTVLSQTIRAGQIKPVKVLKAE